MLYINRPFILSGHLVHDDFTGQRETPWALEGEKTISFNAQE